MRPRNGTSSSVLASAALGNASAPPSSLLNQAWRHGVSSWRAYSAAQTYTPTPANNSPLVVPNVSKPSLSSRGTVGLQNSISAQPRLRNPHGACPVLAGRGWPPGKIPPEIFEHIGSVLCRDDLLRMRLVNHEFEFNISSRVFQSVAVPFEPDIYGMTNINTGRISLRSGSPENQHQKTGTTPYQAPLRGTVQY